MDLFIYKLWNFTTENEENERDNAACQLRFAKIENAMPLINGFYECGNLLTVYLYNETGKFGCVGHVIRENGTYNTKRSEYGVFLPYQDKSLALRITTQALMDMGCRNAAKAVREFDVTPYKIMRMLFSWDRSNIALAKRSDRALSERLAKGQLISVCDKYDCIHWKGDACVLDTHGDGVCKGFMNYNMSPEYNNAFWRVFVDENGDEYRVLRNGVKMEVCGFYFYTEDDIRPHAVRKAVFFEEKTGLSIDYQNLQRLKNDDKYRNNVRMWSKMAPSVMSYPVYPEDESACGG